MATHNMIMCSAALPAWPLPPSCGRSCRAVCSAVRGGTCSPASGAEPRNGFGAAACASPSSEERGGRRPARRPGGGRCCGAGRRCSCTGPAATGGSATSGASAGGPGYRDWVLHVASPRYTMLKLIAPLDAVHASPEMQPGTRIFCFYAVACCRNHLVK